jgi:hypothetical protein
VRRRFAGINVLQWLAIGVVTCAAVMSGAPGLSPGLVALVVGLPFAALFRQPRCRLAGALMVAVGAAGCAVDLVARSAGAARMIVRIGASAVVWRTACLVRRRPPGPVERPEARRSAAAP